MARDLVEEIRKEVQDNKVLIYMKGTKEVPQCGFSAMASQILVSLGAPLKDVNIIEDQEKWKALKTFSQWPTMPQIYIGGKFVGGCDILKEMHAKGELAPLVKQALES